MCVPSSFRCCCWPQLTSSPCPLAAGLLPPPLPSNISPTLLPHQQFYQTYVRQLSALALVPGVCLKFLPPTILEAAGDGVGWWEDEEDLIRCVVLRRPASKGEQVVC